jgi:hypothetical protein
MFIERPPITENMDELHDWLVRFHTKLLGEDLHASETWDAGEIANGAEEANDVTVTGAALGDYAIASLSIDIADLILDAQVTAANTVTCVLANNTGGAIISTIQTSQQWAIRYRRTYPI